MNKETNITTGQSNLNATVAFAMPDDSFKFDALSFTPAMIQRQKRRKISIPTTCRLVQSEQTESLHREVDFAQQNRNNHNDSTASSVFDTFSSLKRNRMFSCPEKICSEPVNSAMEGDNDVSNMSDRRYSIRKLNPSKHERRFTLSGLNFFFGRKFRTHCNSTGPSDLNVVDRSLDYSHSLEANRNEDMHSHDSHGVHNMDDWQKKWCGRTTMMGYCKRQIVAVHRIHIHSPCLNRRVKKELKILRDISHNNLCTFVGACVDPFRVCVLWEFASRGSLRDIFNSEGPRLKPLFIASLSLDLICGLTYLHDSDLRFHGNLKTTNCVVDSRWVLKLTDFGLTAFRNGTFDYVLWVFNLVHEIC